MRLIAGRAFESTSVMIGLVRLDPSKPHRQAAFRALWLLKNQSRWIKRMGLRHGHTRTNVSRKGTSFRSKVEPPPAQFEEVAPLAQI
jgi:hypothetical protein